MTITDEQLEAKEREIAVLLGLPDKAPDSADDRSRERIERIMRRARLESRIQDSIDSPQSDGDANETGIC